MSIAKCLDAKVKAGTISREQAEEALETVKRFERQNAARASQSGADAAAAAQAAEAMKETAKRQQRQAALQILATHKVLEQATSHEKGAFSGVAGVFGRDWWGKAGGSNVEGRQNAVLATLHAMFADGLNSYRSKVAGLKQDVIGLERFVRELYGENSGDATARAAAQAWNDTAAYAAKRFNKAGGHLPNKESWRLPQRFDHSKVKADPAKVRDELLAAYNDGRLMIRDFETGGRADPLKATEIIDQAVESIRTDGLADLVPGQAGGRKLANRRADPRVFEWQNADAWLEFNGKWGLGPSGIYDLLTSHLDSIARDIGLIEVLGPNPDATARVLIDTARKEGVGGLKVYHLEALYDQVTGRANTPVSEGLATFFRGVRSWLASAQLGSAFLTSVADHAFLRQTAAWNGIPSSRVMGSYFKFLADEGAQLKAVRSGVIAEGWARRAAGATRHQAEIVGPELPGRIADFVMRASGLTPHTQAGRWAFAKEFQGHLADLADTAFTKLPDEMKRTFETYGISKTDWDTARAKGIIEDEGVKFFDPVYLIKKGGDAEATAATKLHEMILSEMDFAVPTPGARERALLIGRSRPGTPVGEFVRSTVQYKTFPVTVMTMHLMRGLSNIQAGDRGVYLASTVVGATVMGGFALQLKEIAKGRDPRDMKDHRFWGAAFTQGGGAGILGDFLFAGLSRADRGFYMTAVGGPTAGLVDDLMRLTGGNIQGLAEGRDTHFGAELARFVKMNTPGTSVWYTRLAMERLIWDQLQRQMDPNYAASFARQQQRVRKDYGQSFFWRPGKTSPKRGPDVGASVR